jgi:tRNA splicing ligase
LLAKFSINSPQRVGLEKAFCPSAAYRPILLDSKRECFHDASFDMFVQFDHLQRALGDSAHIVTHFDRKDPELLEANFLILNNSLITGL